MKKLIEFLRRLFHKEKPRLPTRSEYGYHISDEMFSRQWTGKYNDIA